MKLKELQQYVAARSNAWALYAQMIIGVLIDPKEADVAVDIATEVGGGSYCAYDDVRRHCTIHIGIPEFLADGAPYAKEMKNFFGEIDENTVEIMAKGLVNHELRHLCYTRAGTTIEEMAKGLLAPRHKNKFAMIDTYSKLLFPLFNWVEDCRIEYLLPTSRLADAKGYFDALNIPSYFTFRSTMPQEQLETVGHMMWCLMKFGRLPLYEAEIPADMKAAVMSLHEEPQPNGTTKSWLYAFQAERDAAAAMAIFRHMFTIEPFRTYIQTLIADMADNEQKWDAALKKLIEQAKKEITKLGPTGKTTQSQPGNGPAVKLPGNAAGKAKGSEPGDANNGEGDGDKGNKPSDSNDFKGSKGNKPSDSNDFKGSNGNKPSVSEGQTKLADELRTLVRDEVKKLSREAAQTHVQVPAQKSQKGVVAKVRDQANPHNDLDVEKFKGTTAAPAEIKLASRKLRKAFEELKAEIDNGDEDLLSNGDIDDSRLAEIPAGNIRVFMKHNEEAVDKDCAFAIAWDGSGSMCGDKQCQSGAACAIIEEALRGLFPLKIVNFSYGERAKHTVVKNFDESDGHNSAYSFSSSVRFGGGNRDHLAIQTCADDLMKRNEKRKFLFVLSDGLPSEYFGGENGLQMTGGAVTAAREQGIEVVSVFFGGDCSNDVEKIYGAGHVVTCAPNEIPARLCKLFHRIATA